MNVLEVNLDHGKYTVVMSDKDNLQALRYGKPWRSLVGDNLVFTLATELQNARNHLRRYKTALEVLATIECNNPLLAECFERKVREVASEALKPQPPQ